MSLIDQSRPDMKQARAHDVFHTPTEAETGEETEIVDAGHKGTMRGVNGAFVFFKCQPHAALSVPDPRPPVRPAALCPDVDKCRLTSLI